MHCSNGLEPNLIASSGDTIEIEMITHHAGDDFDKMIKGDPGIEDIYKVRKTAEKKKKSRMSLVGVLNFIFLISFPFFIF